MTLLRVSQACFSIAFDDMPMLPVSAACPDSSPKSTWLKASSVTCIFLRRIFLWCFFLWCIFLWHEIIFRRCYIVVVNDGISQFRKGASLFPIGHSLVPHQRVGSEVLPLHFIEGEGSRAHILNYHIIFHGVKIEKNFYNFRTQIPRAMIFFSCHPRNGRHAGLYLFCTKS